MKPRILASGLALVLSLAVAPLGGCTTTGTTGNTPSGSDSADSATSPDPNGVPSDPPPVGAPPPDPPSIKTIDRVQSAADGFVLGAVLGSIGGPIGMAVGAGTMMIYSAITGHVPLRGASGPGRPRGGT